MHQFTALKGEFLSLFSPLRDPDFNVYLVDITRIYDMVRAKLGLLEVIE